MPSLYAVSINCQHFVKYFIASSESLFMMDDMNQFRENHLAEWNGFEGNVMVNVSGGNASALAWKICLDRFGNDRVFPVFADTASESWDTYRFLNDCQRVFGQRIVILQQLNDVGSPMSTWDCFEKHGVMVLRNAGGSCKASVELKQKPLDAHFKSHDFQGQAFGLCPWTEPERCQRRVDVLTDRKCLFPLIADRMSDCEMRNRLKSMGIEPAESYADGAPHNNCLMTGCVLQGLRQWASFYAKYPDRYAEAERKSNAFFERTSFSLLRDRRGGELKDYTLTDLRNDIENGRQISPGWNGSGCSCMEQMQLFDM